MLIGLVVPLIGLILLLVVFFLGAARYRLIPVAAVVFGMLIAATIVSTAGWCGIYRECFLRIGLVYHLAMEFALAMLLYGIGRGTAALFRPMVKRP